MTSEFQVGLDTSNVQFRFLDEEADVTAAEPTAAPTVSADFVTSTDAEIIRETFRVYGSLYLFFFFFFCVARKYFPRFYNIRSWVPEMRNQFAIDQEYGFVSWCWQVFKVTDDQLLENCGMDALCFLRCMRLGARLSISGMGVALVLIPLYLSAEESEETAYLTDIFVKMSIANLPNLSKRFAGAVLGMYFIVLYAMYLITKEYDWFTEFRHKFLSQRKPRNYACYVSGIPEEYRSSYALTDYFRQCSLNTAVMEAHIAIDTPSLDAKVARRDKVVRKLEHVLALERKKGKKQTHRTFKIQNGVDAMRKVDSVEAYRSELSDLNSEIALEIGEIRNANHPLRKHLVRNQGSSDLVHGAQLSPPNAGGTIIETNNISTKTLSTLGTNERLSDRTPMGFQPVHPEDRVGAPGDNQDNQRNGDRNVFREASSGSTDRPGLMVTPASSTGNLDTITELAEIGSGYMEKSPEPVLVRSQSSDSDIEAPPMPMPLPDDDIPQHPFLSMIGLDSSVFAQSFDDVRRKLVRSASDSELTNSIGKTLEDETASESDQAGTGETHSDSEELQVSSNVEMIHDDGTGMLHVNGPGVLHVDGERAENSGDIEEGVARRSPFRNQFSFNASFISRRPPSRSNSGSSSRASVVTIPQSVRRVGEIGAQGVKKVSSGTMVVSSKVRSAMKDVNRDTVSASIKKAGNVGAQSIKTASSIGVASVKKAAQTIQHAPDLGASIAATAAISAAAVVPVLLQKTDGVPREAGFVVFNDLYSTQAARQMLHHPSANKMTVEPAGSPEEIFWRNVGLPAKARRTGVLLSIIATSFLCFFWSIPSAFLSSLTEINSLKQKLPLLSRWIDKAPWMEPFLALMAPLMLLLMNECLLPSILKWFAAWEGHVSSPVLEASLFEKLAAFTIIQTFFVSTISGTISAEISNIIDDPEKIVDLLANSLPAQSSYFIQVCLVFTFFLQGFDLIRAYPLGVAILRNYFFGPRLTVKERRQTWKWFNSLEDPPEFWHAEILAQVMLFFVVYFVYTVIAPISCVFLCGCFVICESGYRYHFIHNNHTYPDSGGRLWQGFVNVLMVSMLIGELTLIGLLVLKKTVYAVPALAPLIAMTVLFMIFVIPKRNHVARHLPTMLCVELDRKNVREENGDARFAKMKYLQPSLKAQPVYAEEEDA